MKGSNELNNIPDLQTVLGMLRGIKQQLEGFGSRILRLEGAAIAVEEQRAAPADRPGPSGSRSLGLLVPFQQPTISKVQSTPYVIDPQNHMIGWIPDVYGQVNENTLPPQHDYTSNRNTDSAFVTN